jgi:hypothetical protein
MDKEIDTQAKAITTKAVTIQPENNLFSLIQSAKDIDADKFEKLLALHERNELRLAEKEFDRCFAEMQKDYVPAYKTKYGAKEAYKYCPLPQILSIYAPILAKHGFSYRWEEKESEDKREKITVCYLSGHGFSRSASISLPYAPENAMINPIQARGATSEYGRRYTFMNVTGCIVADEIDADTQVIINGKVFKPNAPAATQIKEMMEEMNLPESERVKYRKMFKEKGEKLTLETVTIAFNSYLDKQAESK